MIGSNIYWKKTWQNTTINKGNCTFSVVFSLLRWRVKHIYLKISLKFLEICTKHAICLGLEIFLQFYFDSFKLLRWQKPSAKKCWCNNNDFAFHVSNHGGICWMPMWVKKTGSFETFTVLPYFSNSKWPNWTYHFSHFVSFSFKF